MELEINNDTYQIEKYDCELCIDNIDIWKFKLNIPKDISFNNVKLKIQRVAYFEFNIQNKYMNINNDFFLLPVKYENIPKENLLDNIIEYMEKENYDNNNYEYLIFNRGQMWNTIVFEGGGVLGIAYLGALRELVKRDRLKRFDTFAGSSVGSVVAGILACNPKFELLENFLSTLNFKKFKDGSNFIFNIKRLFSNFGIFKGDFIEKQLGIVLQKITGNKDITLKEIYDRYGNTVVITCVALNKKSVYYVSHKTNPNLPLRKLIRMSISIPLFFKCVKYDLDGDGTDDIIVDGGLLDNYPISYFDNYHNCKLDNKLNSKLDNKLDSKDNINTNWKVIGMKLVNSNELYNDESEIRSIGSYLGSLVDTLMKNLAEFKMKKNDIKRTIAIDTGSQSFVNFKINRYGKNILIKRGAASLIKFISF
jgi:NTE family protein